MTDPISALDKAHATLISIKEGLTTDRWSERVLHAKGILALLLIIFGTGALLKSRWALLLLVPGTVLLLFVAYRFIQSSQVDLSKLKGVSPFWEDEASLLKDLGQNFTLSNMRGRILADSVSVILVHGPVGSGKTSLVNAGLRGELPNRPFLYVNAGDANFENSLIKQIEELYANPKTSEQPTAGDVHRVAPETIEEILTGSDVVEHVIIVDDADLDEDKSRLPKWVALALERISPYRVILVLVLSEPEYSANWRLKSWPKSNSLMPVAVERLEFKDALARASALCAKAKMMASETLINNIIAGITMEPDFRVSPLSLSLLIQSIGVNGWRPFGVNDYRASGYATGIMAAYIYRRVSECTHMSHELLAALIRHVSQGSRIVRASDLQVPGMSEQEISTALQALSSPEVRIFRANQSLTAFLVLDDWLPALKVAPNPELGFLEDYVGKKYLWWMQWLREGGLSSSGTRMFRERRYLLAGYELKKLTEGGSTLRNDPGVIAYLARSRSVDNLRSVLRSTAAATCLLGLMLAYVLVRKDQAKKLVHGWGLPDDFAKYGKQINELSVVCMVDDFFFLPRNLTYLEANCKRITSFRGVPSSVKYLDVSDTQVSSLAGLPDEIVGLSISSAHIAAIDGIARYQNLQDLDVRDILVTNMKLLPRSILKLKLGHSGIDNLEGLPEKLTDLEFSGTRVSSLKNVPDSVQRLRVPQNNSLNIDHLPAHLELLEAAYLPDKLELPNSFRTLIFSAPGPPSDVSVIPDQIKEVEFHNSLFEGKFSSSLESLKMYDETSSLPLEKIPASLHHLKIRWPKGASFADLPPKGLSFLDISESGDLESLVGAPSVSELDISHTRISNLNDVPVSVKTLRFNLCGATSLTKFPPNLEKLYLGSCPRLDLVENLPKSIEILDVSGTALPSLSGLEQAEKLIYLDISGTNIRGRLPKLPKNLQTLVLDAGQITTLEGLPRSVKKLVFKGSHG